MTGRQKFVKRSFDLVMASIGLLVCGWLILICWLIATVNTRQNGFFTQQRVGQHGKLFPIIKIRTMRTVKGIETVCTTADDPRITSTGALLRRFKLDELPQLINVLLGHMSFVGPRPDVVGFADSLQGEDRIILSLRPGITGHATLAFRNEEELLMAANDPEAYNRDVIYPAKLRMNKYYVNHYRFYNDVLYIIATVFPGLQDRILNKLQPPEIHGGISHADINPEQRGSSE